MNMKVMKVGDRLRSVTCTTELIVIRAPAGDVVLECGGRPMVGRDASAPVPDESSVLADGVGSQLGKRYADEELGLELLVTKAGSNEPSIDGRTLELKAAKPLPSSD